MSDRMADIQHRPGCYWVGATPGIDGDEAAGCDCGAYELARAASEIESLRQQVAAMRAMNKSEKGRAA